MMDGAVPFTFIILRLNMFPKSTNVKNYYGVAGGASVVPPSLLYVYNFK